MISRAKNIAGQALIAMAGACAAFSIVFTLYWLPGSYKSSRAFVIAKHVLTSDPPAAFNLLMDAIKSFPFEVEPRREAFKPLVNVIAVGGKADDAIATALYAISRAAAGNTPDLLMSRLYYFLNTGLATDKKYAPEMLALLATLRIVNPNFIDTQKIEAAIIHAGGIG